MQTIFGFVNDNRIWRINHAIRHNHIAANRQTVHKNCIIRFCHFRFVNNPIGA